MAPLFHSVMARLFHSVRARLSFFLLLPESEHRHFDDGIKILAAAKK